MKIEISVDSKSMSAGDFLYSLFSGIVSAWDAILQKYSVKERLTKLSRIICFVLALEISFGILLGSIIIFKGDFVILYLGVVTSILLAIYSFKKLYPKI